jgi:hypothetical protein
MEILPSKHPQVAQPAKLWAKVLASLTTREANKKFTEFRAILISTRIEAIDQWGSTIEQAIELMTLRASPFKRKSIYVPTILNSYIPVQKVPL